MSKNRFPAFSSNLNWGTIQIAGLYLLIGCLWILFSDQIAAKIAPNEKMLIAISLYKGWAYVIVTAALLYWLIKRRTEALHTSEEQLQRIVNSVPALMSYIDTEGYYQFTNKAYEEWFGDSVRGKHIEAVLGKQVYQAISKYVDKALAGETVSFENLIPYANGERFVNATYVPDIGLHGQVTGFFALVQDMTAQKQAEEELRLWADAFDGCAHGIAIDNPDTNRIVVCNPAFASLHKTRVEDIVGSAILNLYAPADHEHVRRQIQKADQIGHARYEANMIRKDSSTFPVQMDLVSVLGENGQLLYRVATAQDISERKAMDEKLKESETKYRTLVEHLPAITYISGPDQYIGVSYISPQIEMLGFRRDIWLADPELWFRQILTEDQERVRSELERFRTSGEPFRAEYRLKLPNGEIRWFHDEAVRVKDQQGKPILIQGFMLDITDRKQTEKQLIYQATLLENVNDAIVASDAEYRITLWNSAAESLYGWKTEEVLGRNGLEILRTEWPQEAADEMRRMINEMGRWRGEATQTRKDGSRFPVEVSSIVLYDEDKQITGYVSVNRDITERKQIEEQIEQSNQKLNEILNSIQDDFYVLDRDWNFVYASRLFTSKVGKEPEDFIGTNIWKMFPKHLGTDLEKNFRIAMEKREIRRFEIGGKYTSAWYRMTAFPSAEGITVLGTDITERMQAEQAEQLERARWQSIVEGIADEVWMCDTQGKMSLLNLDAVTAMGLDIFKDRTVEEVYQEVEIFYLDGQPRPPEQAPLLRSLHGEIVRGEEIMRHRQTGRSRYRQFSSAPTRDTSGAITGAVAIVRDITDQKVAEEGLRRFELLSEYSRDIILFMRREDGLILDANRAAIQAYGYNREELLTLTIHDLRAVDTLVLAADQMAQADAGGILFETVHRRQDGSIFPVEVSSQGVTIGGVRTLISIIRDISERKRVEAQLQKAHDELEIKVQERTAALSQANSLLQAMMDYMPDHIYFKDTQSRFIRNSRSQAISLGLNDPAQTIGKTDFDFFPHAAKAYAEEQEVMRSGNPLVDFEEWVVWPDGKETWVSTTKVPLRNSDGETIGIFGISRDITERKKAEQSIRQLNTDLENQAAQLQAANKELEAFSYSVSHDLRAPLRAIDGYTRILVEDYDAILDAEGKRLCGIISAEARRMGQLIDDLLSFSRLGRKQMYTSKIDMRAMVLSGFDELIQEEDRERLDFRVAKLPPVKGDSSLIRQVWINLLSNAIKFSSKKERAVIEVGSKQTPEENIYFVRDNGAGFDMEYANKLFGVFQRLHGESEFEGTGVGLAIVQRIIRRHGGQVWAEGEVDKGATFYFALPRKESHS